MQRQAEDKAGSFDRAEHFVPLQLNRCPVRGTAIVARQQACRLPERCLPAGGSRHSGAHIHADLL